MSEKKSKGASKPEKYVLLFPVTFGSDVVTELEIRRPKAKDIKQLKASANGEFEFKELLKIIANITDQPDPFIDELDIDDAMALVEKVSSFLAGGPATGKS